MKLLFAAAGIQHLSIERPQRGSSASGSGSSGGSSGAGSTGPEFLTASAVKLVLRNDTAPHFGALKELVYVYREGEQAAALFLESQACAACRRVQQCMLPLLGTR